MAGMAGYATVVNPRAGALRKAEATDKESRASCRTSVVLSENGKTAIFVLADGTEIAADVPDFPPTHRAVAHQPSGAILVLPMVPLDGPGDDAMLKFPDNPDGPAVLVCRNRTVEGMWFSRGKRIAQPTGPGTSAVP